MRIIFVVIGASTLINVKEARKAIPPQVKGAKSDIVHSIVAASDQQGMELYDKARKNLLNINGWQQLAGKLSAAFYLTDPFGQHVNRLPLQGDFIKIHLPTSTEDKFEWVRIEAIEEQRTHSINYLAIRVRPSDPPRAQEETEHFFSKDATSSFIVERKGRKVEARVQGRNELPNFESKGLMNKLRNMFIGLGAMAGMNYPQWKGLAKGVMTT